MKLPVVLRNIFTQFLILSIFPACEAGPRGSVAKRGKLGQISAINPPKRLFREARSCFSASLTLKWGDMPYFFHILLRRRSNLRFWDFGTSVFFLCFPSKFDAFVLGGTWTEIFPATSQGLIFFSKS